MNMQSNQIRIQLTKGNAVIKLRDLPNLVEGDITFRDDVLDSLRQLLNEVDNVVEKLKSVDGMEAYAEAFNAWKAILQKSKAGEVLGTNVCWLEEAEEVTERVGRGEETIKVLLKEVTKIRKVIAYEISNRFGRKKDDAMREVLGDPSVAEALTKALETAGVVFN